MENRLKAYRYTKYTKVHFIHFNLTFRFKMHQALFSKIIVNDFGMILKFGERATHTLSTFREWLQ